VDPSQALNFKQVIDDWKSEQPYGVSNFFERHLQDIPPERLIEELQPWIDDLRGRGSNSTAEELSDLAYRLEDHARANPPAAQPAQDLAEVAQQFEPEEPVQDIFAARDEQAADDILTYIQEHSRIEEMDPDNIRAIVEDIRNGRYEEAARSLEIEANRFSDINGRVNVNAMRDVAARLDATADQYEDLMGDIERDNLPHETTLNNARNDEQAADLSTALENIRDNYIERARRIFGNAANNDLLENFYATMDAISDNEVNGRIPITDPEYMLLQIETFEQQPPEGETRDRVYELFQEMAADMRREINRRNGMPEGFKKGGQVKSKVYFAESKDEMKLALLRRK
jgi:hypothetical protein